MPSQWGYRRHSVAFGETLSERDSPGNAPPAVPHRGSRNFYRRVDRSSLTTHADGYLSELTRRSTHIYLGQMAGKRVRSVFLHTSSSYDVTFASARVTNPLNWEELTAG